MNLQNPLVQTNIDIKDDFLFIQFLTESYSTKILQAKKRILSLRREFSPYVFSHIVSQIEIIEEAFYQLSTSIFQSLKEKENTQFNTEYAEYIKQYDLLRSLISSLSGILLGLDSQSPSFFSSYYSQAGQFTGQIKQSFNDYRRDQHQFGNTYEQAFQKEYIDAPLKFPFHVYATQSGMAALTTIIGYIKGQTNLNGPVFLGRSSYFEEQILIKTFFGDKVILVDEMNIDELCFLIQKHNPSIFFLDSLSNSSSLNQPDIAQIIIKCKHLINNPCFFVVDNTGLSSTYQPFKGDFFPHQKLHIIVWESLLKHHQFGIDRVNAGIIYTNIQKGIDIYTYRDHLGTNISDFAALSLPTPSRKFLEQRLFRHERNVIQLINIISQKVNSSSPFISIVSPLIPDHPSFSLTRNKVFHGAYVALRFKSEASNLRYYKNFLKKAFSLAKKRNIPLIGGTSFGFPITRLYIPASRPGQGTPFVRIAVGSEPLLNFLSTAEVIAESLN